MSLKIWQAVPEVENTHHTWGLETPEEERKVASLKALASDISAGLMVIKCSGSNEKEPHLELLNLLHLEIMSRNLEPKVLEEFGQPQ